MTSLHLTWTEPPTFKVLPLSQQDMTWPHSKKSSILGIFGDFGHFWGNLGPKTGQIFTFGPNKKNSSNNVPTDTENPKKWNEPRPVALEPVMIVAHPRRRHHMKSIWCSELVNYWCLAVKTNIAGLPTITVTRDISDQRPETIFQYCCFDSERPEHHEPGGEL